MDRQLDSRAPELAFERKVQASAWAVFFERLWPRVWLVLGIVGAFVAVSLAGVWPLLGEIPHRILLALFALALLAALVFMARVRWPSREESIRRIERVSGIAHRPASSYEDTLSAAGDPTTVYLWQAHRARLAQLLKRLKVGPPRPRTDRYDPLAVRALMLLGVLLLLALVGDSASDRILSAFRLGSHARLAEARLDAWVTPPSYTGKAPVMLADGGRPGAISGEDKTIEVPANSVLIVRSSGQGIRLALEVAPADGGAHERIAAEPLKGASDVSEQKLDLKHAATVRVLDESTKLAQWTFSVIPDQPPKIALTKDPERMPRGSMKLSYKIEDDYGVASAVAKFKKATPKAGDQSKSWARRQPLTGPRPPLERPPVLALRVPRSTAKEAEAQTYLELGQHPWAGLRVVMTLEARDVAGQVGRSEPLEMIMPARRFEKPLARAIVEQRRKLVDDPRYREEVLRALDALTLEPEGFMTPQTYLSLKTAQHRLQRSRTRAVRQSVIEQLWHIALRLEDGDLSDAERRLREAQDKLSKALEDGAPDNEIQNLMQELRQALNDYMEQLQRQAGNQQEMPSGMDPNNQMLSQQDLERMMRNIEEMARSGSREQAQQMLSEMRDLLERLQAGRMSEEQMRQSREMMQKMDELGNLAGQQQQLLDDTFGEMRQQGQRGQQQNRQGERGGDRGGQQGQQGERGDRRGQQGQQGQGQGQRQAQPGQQGQQGQGRQGQQGQGGLGQRQGDLRDKLGRLQRDLRDLGMSGSQQLDTAREAMESAERALEQGDLDQATQDQARALDQLRQGAQQMAQEMMRNMPQRYGQSGDTPRDPLGRPQRSEGPDLGTSVKVPDEIDMQRAREILEELRRRIGEQTRPPVELDYLERLLRQQY